MGGDQCATGGGEPDMLGADLGGAESVSCLVGPHGLTVLGANRALLAVAVTDIDDVVDHQRWELDVSGGGVGPDDLPRGQAHRLQVALAHAKSEVAVEGERRL